MTNVPIISPWAMTNYCFRGMKIIKAFFKPDDEKYQQESGKADHQSGNVDDAIGFMSR